MFKKSKKIISIILTICFIFSMCIQSTYAASPQSEPETLTMDGKTITVQTLVDNDTIRKVIAVEDNKKSYTSTYNKKTTDLKVEETDLATQTTKVIANTNVTKALKDAKNQNIIIDSQGNITATATVIARNTGQFWPTSYTYWSYKKWLIINSKRAGKYATETSSNSSDLLSFKSSVDSQCNYEVAAASATGAAICAAAVAAVTAPTGAGAFVAAITALGGVGAAGYSLYSAWQQKNNCDFYYSRVR